MPFIFLNVLWRLVSTGGFDYKEKENFTKQFFYSLIFLSRVIKGVSKTKYQNLYLSR